MNTILEKDLKLVLPSLTPKERCDAKQVLDAMNCYKLDLRFVTYAPGAAITLCTGIEERCIQTASDRHAPPR